MPPRRRAKNALLYVVVIIGDLKLGNLTHLSSTHTRNGIGCRLKYERKLNGKKRVGKYMGVQQGVKPHPRQNLTRSLFGGSNDITREGSMPYSQKGGKKGLNSGPLLVPPPTRNRTKIEEKTRKFTKKTHLWRGVENEAIMLMLLILWG